MRFGLLDRGLRWGRLRWGPLWGRLRLGQLLPAALLCCGSFIASPALAGPQEYAVLIPHLQTSLEYTSSVTSYAGQSDLDDCGQAVVQGRVDGEKAQVWFVLVSFAESPGPVALIGAEFGFGDFNAGKVSFVGWGQCLPASMEIPSSPGWPGPGEGVATVINLSQADPEADTLEELYWFATYVYSPVTIPLSVNPDTQAANVIAPDPDPEIYIVQDRIETFGSIGFGQAGENPCASPAHPTGGCCLWGACEVLREEDCDEQGGHYLGDFSACFPNPCPAPIETSWGSLKKMYEDIR